MVKRGDGRTRWAQFVHILRPVVVHAPFCVPTVPLLFGRRIGYTKSNCSLTG